MEGDPTQRRRPSARAGLALAGMAALAAMGESSAGGSFVYENALKGVPRGPRGNSMKRIGKTEDGEEILQDRGGRKYIRAEHGTIRRLKKGLG